MTIYSTTSTYHRSDKHSHFRNPHRTNSHPSIPSTPPSSPSTRMQTSLQNPIHRYPPTGRPRTVPSAPPPAPTSTQQAPPPRPPPFLVHAPHTGVKKAKSSSPPQVTPHAKVWTHEASSEKSWTTVLTAKSASTAYLARRLRSSSPCGSESADGSRCRIISARAEP